jgi:hypothetical protein
MQGQHIALRREALVAKGEETLVARAEALKVLRAWMLRAFVELFSPPYPHRRSSLSKAVLSYAMSSYAPKSIGYVRTQCWTVILV